MREEKYHVELNVECGGIETAGVIIEIARERKRQIEFYRFTPAGDDGHDTGALALAAGCYALAGTRADDSGDVMRSNGAIDWPFDSQWWKPKDARRNLIKAAALIVAEIERLDRKADGMKLLKRDLDFDPDVRAADLADPNAAIDQVEPRLPIPRRSR